MLRSQPIVRDERRRSRPGRNMADKVAVAFRRPKSEPTAMQVEDRFACPRIRRMHPESRYTADDAFLERDVIAFQNGLHHSVVPRTGFRSRGCAFARTDRGTHGGG